MGNGAKKKIGNRIRNLIEPVLNDENTLQIQLGILDKVFETVAQEFPKMLEKDLNLFIDKIARVPAQDKNRRIVEALTVIDPGTKTTEYSPIFAHPIKISTFFTKFAARDIRELPGYVHLHEVARAEDVDIEVTGLVAEEGTGARPVLVIHGNKHYMEGAINNALYPALPEVVSHFDRRSSGSSILEP